MSDLFYLLCCPLGPSMMLQMKGSSFLGLNIILLYILSIPHQPALSGQTAISFFPLILTITHIILWKPNYGHTVSLLRNNINQAQPAFWKGGKGKGKWENVVMGLEQRRYFGCSWKAQSGLQEGGSCFFHPRVEGWNQKSAVGGEGGDGGRFPGR